MGARETTRATVRRWVAAVESGDPERVLATLAPDCRYINVPEDPVIGHDAIRGLFAPILGRAEDIVFEVVSESYEPGRGWLERDDRFVIDGVEYAVVCNGVFEVDVDREVITEVRDYLDLGDWRRRLAEVHW